MNKKMQRDFKGTPLVTESLKLLRVHHGAEFLLGKPIKVKRQHFQTKGLVLFYPVIRIVVFPDPGPNPYF
jgi:hypothetical protein